MFHHWKGTAVRIRFILYLFNTYAERKIRKVGLEESTTGIEISGRSINNLRYADDTTVLTQSAMHL